MSFHMRFKFSGHQTFAFRYGWLEKGVREVEKLPIVFTTEDAPMRLGVGKNMVESIRHWCEVTQLIEDEAGTGTTDRGVCPSPIAQTIFLNGAWDPFLENDATLWLIHWLLVSNPRLGTTGKLAFGHFQRPDFSKRELIDFIGNFAEKHSIKVRENSLARDVDCFLRTYLACKIGPQKGVVEESFDCPLQELGLIQASPDGDLYRFAIGPKPSLPASIFAFALDQFFRRAKTGETLGVQECLYGAESPGQAFKLDENSLIEYIEEIEELTNGAIGLDETAGLKQIYRRQHFDVLKLLDRFFGRKGAK